MLTRSRFRLLITASLLASIQVAPVFSATPPKPGSACKKSGITQEYASKSYTCKRVNGKLVWSKGTKIAGELPMRSGSVPTPASPSPTPIAVSPVEACKLPVADGRGDVAIGFPRIPDRMKSIGTVIAPVIMVDFPDAPATMTPQDAFAKISGATASFKEMSYNKFNYEMRPVFKWYRMSKTAGEYTQGGWSFEKHKIYIQEALRLADPDVDFSNAESFIILANPDAKSLGYSGPAFSAIRGNGVTFDGKYIANGATSAADLPNWGHLWANHELTHTLGLVDVYAFQNAAANGIEGPFKFTGEFSYMGKSTTQSNAPSLFAWERWLMNWVTDSQISCLKEASGKVTLTALQNEGGTKALVIPLGGTKALVVESRKKIGLDSNMRKAGALVYRVDTSRQSGLGPIQVFPISASDPNYFNAPLALGESITAEGWTIKVTASDSMSDTVEVVKG